MGLNLDYSDLTPIFEPTKKKEIMRRKYFAFPNDEESPAIDYAMAIMEDDAYYCINDHVHGAQHTIYACDASIETPEVLLPFMYYSHKTDEILDREFERRAKNTPQKGHTPNPLLAENQRLKERISELESELAKK